MEYEKFHETININGKETEVTFYKNPEYLRDYCGQFHDKILFNNNENLIVKSPEAYLYFLPNAIDALVRVYHAYGLNCPASIAKMDIYNRVLINVRNFNLFSDDTDPFDVYVAIFESSYLGKLLRMTAQSIMNSDFYRAKYYVNYCITDDTIRKILDKNLNNHKPNDIKINKEIFNLVNTIELVTEQSIEEQTID